MGKTVQPLPATGFLRLPQIIGTRKTNPPTPPLIPVGRSTWLKGVKDGRYPAPVKGLGSRITVWRVEDILALIDHIGQGNNCVQKKSGHCADASPVADYSGETHPDAHARGPP